MKLCEIFEQAGDATESPEFRRWFAGSKVVDAAGKPLKVFHGTYANFSQFHPGSHFGTVTAANQRVRYLTRHFPFLEPGDGSRILPVYLRITNPLRVSDAEAAHESSLLQSIVKGKYPDIDLDVAWKKGAYKAAQKAGYDGLIYKNRMEDRGKLSYVIFDPSQVRSAISFMAEGGRSKPTPAEQFITAAKADPRAKFCNFDIHGRDSVILTWLEGSGGLMPFLTGLADQFGVTLDLMVEVYGLHDGGKLVPYYERNGFTIEGSDFPDDFDFAGMPTSDEFSKLRGIVSMTRKPQKRLRESAEKPSIDAHQAGDHTIEIEMISVPYGQRGEGIGRKTYEEWEANLPEWVHLVTAWAADTGSGDSYGFWEAMGFDYKYVPDKDSELGPEDFWRWMWKGVNGHPTPPSIPVDTFEGDEE